MNRYFPNYKKPISFIFLVFEKNMWTYKEIYSRFKWYGSGDYYYYRYNSNKWTMSRKVRSLSHPLRQFALQSYEALRAGSPTLIGCFFLLAILRYYGWMSKALKH